VDIFVTSTDAPASSTNGSEEPQQIAALDQSAKERSRRKRSLHQSTLTLRLFAINGLPASKAGIVERHTGGCARCMEALEKHRAELLEVRSALRDKGVWIGDGASIWILVHAGQAAYCIAGRDAPMACGVATDQANAIRAAIVEYAKRDPGNRLIEGWRPQTR
jgi:hypothetical protein